MNNRVEMIISIIVLLLLLFGILLSYSDECSIVKEESTATSIMLKFVCSDDLRNEHGDPEPGIDDEVY
jgi:hypothetical protein